jgi:RND family efflux transporter MFP subunit
MRKRGRSRRARALTATGVAAAVVVAGGAAASYATSQGTAPVYVAAIVTSHPVVQTLQATGTTEPSSAATVSFAVSGIVATVPVAMGAKVTAGQVLATLDTTSLKYALATAQGQVANAELTLAQAESGQVSAASGTAGTTGAVSSKPSSTGTGSAATGSAGTGSTTGTGSGKTSTTGTGSGKTSTTGTGSTTGSSGSSHSGSGLTASITAAQKRLLATARQTDSALTKAKADLAAATTLCTSQMSASPSPSPSSSPSASSFASPSASGTASPAVAATGPSTTCIQAQQTVLNDESQLFTLQKGLSGQETALDKLLTSSASSIAPTSAGKTSTATASTATASAGTTSAGTVSAGKASGSTGSAGSTTVAVSAAQLAADQAAVDATNAALAVAQQQLGQASIVSPFTGVVSSVGLTIGQQATAGSSTTAVDVIDPTGHGVTLSVDVTKIPQVKVGQKATVVPDGSATPLAATVSYVAAAPSTTSSTVYPVQLTFTGNPTTLRDGIQAAVTITTAQAADALAVPTSAVNHRGALDYVLVLNGSTTKTQIITVGALGAIYTQVTQGLTAGQRVVLANPDQAIPTSTVTGRIARITGGATNTTGVLGGTAGTTGTTGGRPGG